MRVLALLFLLLMPGFRPAAGQPLSVDTIEPPNWWAGMGRPVVQLMVYGDALHGLEASFAAGGPQVTGVHTVASPSYAFITITIPHDLPPGDYPLTLRAGGRTTTRAYPILARAAPAGRFQGFDPSDTVYLITPDRFANGDPSNDHVDDEGLLAESDRTKPGMRHGGDLQGLIDHLDYLADLGVTALWLNPVLENSGRMSYHGYAATDLYRIDPRFGTNDDYRRFVDEAHRRGLKVIFDHVNNHIGVRHRWVDNPPTPTWFNGAPGDPPPSHYKLAVTDPYAAATTVEDLQGFWFVAGMPDLNQRDPLLADYLIQNTLWWIEFSGLDGIREDTYPYADLGYLARWAETILAAYPRFNIVGEIWEGEPGYLAQFQTESYLPRNFETNLPAIMDFPLGDAFRAYLRGEGTLDGVYKVLAQDFLYTDPDNIMTMFDNHDMTRGIFEAGGDTQKVKQVLAMLLTMRGIPQLLYGTEINMMGGASHVELRADMPGGFPGDTRSVFTAAGRTAEENEVFDFTRTLLHLRKQHPALTHGYTIHYPPRFLGRPPWREDVYRYFRMVDDESILVVVNGHDEAQQADLTELARWLTPEGSASVQVKDLLTDETLQVDLAAGLPVPARGVRIVQVLQGRR